MDLLSLTNLLAPSLIAAGGFVAFQMCRRNAEQERRRRETSAAAERTALLLEDEALRTRLHAANEALRLRAEALHRILRASTELKAHLPLETVLANIVRAASASLGYRFVLLSLHDRADGVLAPRAHVGLSDRWPELEPLRIPSERIAGTRSAAGSPSPFSALLPRSPLDEVVSVALVAGEQLVGLLELAGPDRADAVGEEDRIVLELFGSQVVNAIRLARAHETTRLGSLRDPLTGIANHGHFQETLYREVTRHARSGERLVLLMADLDDFKTVNDRHGHPAGDAVLKAVVARILESVREMDTVARYGGEEFSIILPQTDADSGRRVAERLRAAVASSPVQAGAPEPLRLTISIGLAVYPDDTVSKGGLVECADRALYAAKRTGKNRVVRFTKVPASAESLLTGRT
ncbi:MAG: sensor domain-containing diguanylate cyclase [Holophagales bacterium]|nr:sensor domain-containing diguanylate cyclase [Holophagales bacterium]